MKKVSCVFLVLLVLFSFCGCQLSEIGLSDIPLVKFFECDLSVNADGKEYYCHFKRYGNSAEISVTEPERISGLTLVYENDVYSVSFKGVTISLDDSKNQYVRFFADGLIKNLEEAFSSESFRPVYENGNLIYNGSGEYGEFTLCFDTDGRLLSVEIPSVNTVITVENFQFLTNPQ